MSFHVGQKVVCVRTWVRRGGHGDEIGPVEGQEYTIRAIGYLNPRFPDYVTVHLDEILNGERAYFEGESEVSFWITRFRPLVEDRKSVSFTIGADPDSDIWDNRKKTKEKV